MVSDKMRRKWFLRIWSVVLVMQFNSYDRSCVDAGVSRASSTTFKGHPKIDLKDPFYNGQIQYDDALTETPIGTIVYAIDDDIDDDTSFIDSNKKAYQLQDVVTHSGNINNKSFINHNVLAIGSDGNDANIDEDADDDLDGEEGDDEVVDLVDNDGVVDKQALNNHREVFNSFNDRYDPHSRMGVNLPRTKQNQLTRKQQQLPKPTPLSPIIANDQEPKQQQRHEENEQVHDNGKLDLRQGQSHTSDNNVTETHLPNEQMTHKHLNKTTSTARMKPHQHHHNHRKAHNSKWYRRHHKLMKLRKNKSHREHQSASRSGLKSQRIRTSPKSSLRSGSSSYVQAHVNFYDSNTFDDTLRSNRFSSDLPSRTKSDKWPHLTRLQNQLHQDMLGDKLPPYIKKYNRRNKQLLSLLEGQGMPNVDNTDQPRRKQLHSHRRRQKAQNKWIEKNLFEEQQQNSSTDAVQSRKSTPVIVLNSKQRYLSEKNVQREPNALPGEHLTISEEYADCEDGSCIPLTSQPSQKSNIKKKEILSPKADSFLFHRVATPRLVGTAAIGGGLVKQRLPFVALTDKRIGENSAIRQQRVDTMQNTFPLP